MTIGRYREASNLLLLGLFAAIMMYVYGGIRYESDMFANLDLHAYRAMAEAAPGLAVVNQPFAYRLLGPFVVGILPFSEQLGFRLLAVIASFVLVFLFYRYLRASGISGRAALFAVAMFISNRYFFGFFVWDYFQLNDILSLIALIILFKAAEQRSWLTFSVALLIGLLARETPLLMIPVTAFLLIEQKASRLEWRRFLMAALPAVCLFFATRLVVPISGGSSLPQALFQHAGKLLSPITWVALLALSFTPAGFIPLIFFRQTKKFFAERRFMLVYLLLVIASTAFGHDNQRLMSPAFIIFYFVLADIADKAILPHRLLTAIIMVSALIASPHYVMGRFLLPNRTITGVLSLGSLMIVTLAALTYRLTVLRPLRSNP